jgi:hypothetical protein
MGIGSVEARRRANTANVIQNLGKLSKFPSTFQVDVPS